jgi:hypothetical protein
VQEQIFRSPPPKKKNWKKRKSNPSQNPHPRETKGWKATFFIKTLNETYSTLSFLFPRSSLQSGNVIARLQTHLLFSKIKLFVLRFCIFTPYGVYIYSILYIILLYIKTKISQIFQCQVSLSNVINKDLRMASKAETCSVFHPHL